MVAILPFFATAGWPFSFLFAPDSSVGVANFRANSLFALDQSQADAHEKELKQRAQKIDAYFKDRGMPLAGRGLLMVRAAEENDLDWRLLPAIAVRESSGGKQMCGSNPFGWASCKVRFKSVDEAVNTVASHLGGNEARTESYYSGSTDKKLHAYNGTVVPTYANEVKAIMDKIEAQDIEDDTTDTDK